MSRLFDCDNLSAIAEYFPKTLYKAKVFLGLEKDMFTKYVMCPRCDKLYTHEQSFVTTSTGKRKSATCNYVEFPRHPHKKQRQQCGALLLKHMRSKTGTEYLVPKRTYCYQSLIQALQNLTQRHGFLESCNSWKKNVATDGVYRDIYDGAIWKNFKDRNGNSFWDDSHNLGLTINIDWFQPHRHTVNSVGAIYLVIQNLPRTERYKEENVILVGIIPGPSEPHHDINSYLAPLVDELLELWVGVELEDTSDKGKNTYRAALLCVACDTPGARKTAGFMSHTALHGTQVFPNLDQYVVNKCTLQS